MDSVNNKLYFLAFLCFDILFNSYEILFYSKRIGNLISKANNNKESSKCRYCMNMELDPLNEKLMYREYIICLKKHQLAIE